MTTAIPGLGFLYALHPDQALRAAETGGAGARLDAVLAPLRGDPGLTAEVDRAWMDIHRALALDDPDGDLRRALLGGRALADVDGRVVRLVASEEVVATARALDRIDLDDFRDRFLACLEGEPDEEADEAKMIYAWSWFLRLRALYAAAAAGRRAVLFTAQGGQAARAA